MSGRLPLSRSESPSGFSLPPPSRPPPPSGAAGRVLTLVAISIVALSVAGFLKGVAEERRPARRVPSGAASAAAPAPGYEDLRSLRRGPNGRMYEGAIEAFGQRFPQSLDPVPPQSAEDRARVLEERSRRRAYDGAPPTIPHAVVADGAFECLGCHERGALIAGKRAPAMSHERHDNCTQCHAPPSGQRTADMPPLADNGFVGLAPASSGARAWPGAPPMIPHPTLMRSTCTSCHGTSGALGMRSTHPWRQNCLQCHAPSAALDQRPGERSGHAP
jgi:nitrate reductase (cytochrome), electron transfer subunit